MFFFKEENHVCAFDGVSSVNFLCIKRDEKIFNSFPDLNESDWTGFFTVLDMKHLGVSKKSYNHGLCVFSMEIIGFRIHFRPLIWLFNLSHFSTILNDFGNFLLDLLTDFCWTYFHRLSFFSIINDGLFGLLWKKASKNITAHSRRWLFLLF